MREAAYQVIVISQSCVARIFFEHMVEVWGSREAAYQVIVMFNPKGYDSLTSGVEFCWIDSQCNFTPSDFQYHHRHRLRH